MSDTLSVVLKTLVRIPDLNFGVKKILATQFYLLITAAQRKLQCSVSTTYLQQMPGTFLFGSRQKFNQGPIENTFEKNSNWFLVKQCGLKNMPDGDRSLKVY